MGKRVLGWRLWMNAEPTVPPTQNRARQLFGYALIGGLSNLSGYALYLLVTHSGGTPKLTMTVMYAVGVMVSFFANRKFTFRDDGPIAAAGVRFMFAHALGYLLNLLLLVAFVDWLGFAHQMVQALAIIVVAVFLFALFRAFVFSQKPRVPRL